MRKIYPSAPDVPQVLANRAIDIVERQFAADGVRRAADLPEESKVHMMRELEAFFLSELPPIVCTKDGDAVYDWNSRKGKGLIPSIVRWLEKVMQSEDDGSQR